MFDDWGNDITNQTILQVNVLSGAIRAIGYNEPNCQCYNVPEPCIYGLRSCKPGDFTIRSDCENNYASHDSQILIHPPNQPY